MEDRTNRLAVKAPRILVLVTILAALFTLLLQTDSATYAQTESSALDAPSLTAASSGPNAVELDWNSVSGAVRYELWAWQDIATGWQRLDDGALTGTSDTHSGLKPGATYHYAVRAVDANDAAGALSAYATATVPQSQSSIAAPALTAEAGTGQVTLTWQAVTGAVRYELWVWWDSATGWQRLDSGNLTGISYVHDGLAAGTTYHYAMRAVDANGVTSALSEYASATVSETQIPALTSTPTSTPTTTSAPAITPSPTSTSTPTSTSAITPTPTSTPTPAVAITSTPTSTPSSTTAITPTPTPTSAALAAPTLTAEAGTGQVTLTWEAVTGAVRYELWVWWDSATGWQRLDSGNLTGISYVHDGLAAGTTYHYAMHAVDANGVTSALSEYASATVSETQMPALTSTPTSSPTLMSAITSTPTSTSAITPTPTSTPTPAVAITSTVTTTPSSTTAITPTPTPTLAALSAPTLTAEAGAGQITLTWNTVAGAVRYELWAWDSVNGWQQLDDGALTDTSYTHRDLTPGTTYHYAIRAVSDDDATSAWSEYANATVSEVHSPDSTATPTATPTSTSISGLTPTPTPTAGAMSAPILTAEAGAGAVELRWEAVPGAASYELRAWSSAGGWEQLDDGALSATIFTHDGLTAGTTYYYWVRAVSEAGETGDWSDRKDATPSAPETPTPTPTAATTERGALVALHEATNGDNWTSNDNWLSDEPLGSWFGVTTDESGRVVELRLPDNGLRGQVPDLSALNHLRELHLGLNQLSGSIPDLGDLTNLPGCHSTPTS